MRIVSPIALAGILTLGLAAPVAGQSDFVRSDCNVDGATNIADSVYILAFLFSGGAAPDCEDACDSNDDGALNIADAVAALGVLFPSGPPPVLPAPYPGCGTDPTEPDGLTCDAFPPCP